MTDQPKLVPHFPKGRAGGAIDFVPERPIVVDSVAAAEAWLAAHDPGTDAYDGSTAPQRRSLTARERDVLARMLTFLLHDDAYATPAEKVRLLVIRDVLDPRREETVDPDDEPPGAGDDPFGRTADDWARHAE